MGARIPLPDGRQVPVSDAYADQWDAMSAQERKAEYPALMRQAEKQGLQPPTKDQPAAARTVGSDIGTAATPPADPAGGQQAPGVSTGEDVLRSFGAGGRRGLEGIMATPQDLTNLVGRGLSWARGKDFNQADYDVPLLPSSEDIHQFTTDLGVGESYVPQTPAGKFASSVGEFAGGSVGPGMVLSPARAFTRAGLTALGGGIASEAAGEATEGTSLEPIARLAGGVAGAGVGGMGRGGVRNIKETPGRKIEQAAEDAANQHGVKLTKGQRSGDVVQQQKEDQMLGGARGGLAQRLMEQRKRANLEAVKDASLKIQDTAAPSRGTLPTDSAASLNRQTADRAEQLRQQGGAKIESALQGGGVMVDADLLRDLPEEIRQKLTGADLDLPEHTLDDLTPVANNAMARIDKFTKTFEDPAKFSELSLQRVDRLRRQVIDLTKDAKPGSTDSRALGAIIEHFDDWLLNAAGKGSIKQGPNVQGGRSASQVAAELKAGQQTYKEGSRISQPRGADLKEPGAKQVRSIADRRQHAEDTARLLKPNDRGELSPAALDTIERLKQVGGSSGDLDQVRGIVMDQLMTGDPGKVATRIDNFTRNNPTAAAHLFTPEQLQQMRDFGTTNRSLVPKPEATNPSRSSYPIVAEIGKQAARGIPGLNIVTGPLADTASATRGFLEAKRALKEADRSGLAEEMVRGGAHYAARAAPVSARVSQSVTINDPDDPHDGEKAVVVSEGKNGFKVRLSNGQEKIIGKNLVKQVAP